MPFRVDKTKQGLYALWNIKKKEYRNQKMKHKMRHDGGMVVVSRGGRGGKMR